MSSNKLTLQVLAVTMHQSDHSLPEKMNLQSDALIGNQADRVAFEEWEHCGRRVKMFTFPERGVGRNRNNLILRADADIVLFADDDVVYDDGYEKIVLDAFEQHPEADAITFDVIPLPETINPDLNGTWHRIRWYNCLKYGAPRIAVRTKVLREKNIYYTLLFGGGAPYASGEDSIFVADLVKNKVRFYACPQRIGTVTFETSSWYTGFDEKYFKDKGLLFYFLSHRFAKPLCLQYCIRRKGLFSEACSPKQAYKLMVKGIKEYKKGQNP